MYHYIFSVVAIVTWSYQLREFPDCRVCPGHYPVVLPLTIEHPHYRGEEGDRMLAEHKVTYRSVPQWGWGSYTLA